MPDVDGLEACRRLRRCPSAPTRASSSSTAAGQVQDRALGLAVGAISIDEALLSCAVWSWGILFRRGRHGWRRSLSGPVLTRATLKSRTRRPWSEGQELGQVAKPSAAQGIRAVAPVRGRPQAHASTAAAIDLSKPARAGECPRGEGPDTRSGHSSRAPASPENWHSPRAAHTVSETVAQGGSLDDLGKDLCSREHPEQARRAHAAIQRQIMCLHGDLDRSLPLSSSTRVRSSCATITSGTTAAATPTA